MVFKSFSIKQSENLLVLSTEKFVFNKFDAKVGIAIYLKIFLNYLQMISIIRTFDLKWPSYVNNYLNIFSFFGGVSSDIISVDCLLYAYNKMLKNIYINTLFMISFPFALIFLSGFFILLNFLYSGKFHKIRLVVIIIIISIFLQPLNIQVLFDNLKCLEINKSLLLEANMSIDCQSEEHQKWVFIFIFIFF